jgi:hypothetical protein
MLISYMTPNELKDRGIDLTEDQLFLDENGHVNLAATLHRLEYGASWRREHASRLLSGTSYFDWEDARDDARDWGANAQLLRELMKRLSI